MDRNCALSPRRVVLACALLLAAAPAPTPAEAQMVGGGVNGMQTLQAAQNAQASGSNVVAMPGGGNNTNSVRPTINGQGDPYAVNGAQGAATGQYAAPMGSSSVMPASGLQTSAQAGAQQSAPGTYGGIGEPAAAPRYSIQGGGYTQPQYMPQAGQSDPNMVATSPAYNQIPSPYAAARTPAPSYGAPYGGAPGAPYAQLYAPPVMEGGYTLGPGDKVHLTVFGEADLTNDYIVDGNGNIRLPLGGIVRAAGNTAQGLEAAVYYALVPNYLRNPRLTVDILAYRPIYVTGQVQHPGQFAYTNEMTMMNAIGMAGGFTQQARESSVYVRHAGDPVEQEVPTSMPLLIRPGDTVRVDTTLFWDAMNMISPLSGPASLAMRP